MHFEDDEEREGFMAMSKTFVTCILIGLLTVAIGAYLAGPPPH